MITLESNTRAGLNSLELLGAFFISQIHDLNNQMAILSNSEWLQPAGSDVGEMQEFVRELFTSIHRVSATWDQMNAARKSYPINVGRISLEEAVREIIGVAAQCPGWSVVDHAEGDAHILLKLEWLPMILAQLTGRMQSGGVMEISVGELPPRHYEHAIRATFSQDSTRVLLLHLKGSGDATAHEALRGQDFEIAMELIRLMGSGVSLGRTDSEKDCLLAFRLQP